MTQSLIGQKLQPSGRKVWRHWELKFVIIWHEDVKDIFYKIYRDHLKSGTELNVNATCANNWVIYITILLTS